MVVPFLDFRKRGEGGVCGILYLKSRVGLGTRETKTFLLTGTFSVGWQVTVSPVVVKSTSRSVTKG